MDSAYRIDQNKKLPINIDVDKLSYTILLEGGTSGKLTCFRQKPRETSTKVVLDEISLSVKSGQILAIMGCSGSGKTSLLNVLACKNICGHVTGDIKLNGVKHTKHMIETFSSYVRQDDRLLQHLTVRESLMFVAQLKLPTKFTNPEVEMKVHEVITELGLGHVANTRVGGTNIRGVSGGERRRVSIGIQLLLNPSILFLDEPTSGLDAFTAHHLMHTLANLAKNQRTVILSIHQPRSDIFDLFDMVLVLSMGKTVYFGESNLMEEYFTTLGFPCPDLTNPSDFYLDLATVDVTSVETEKKTSVILTNLVDAYQQGMPHDGTGSEASVSSVIQDYTISVGMGLDTGYPGFFKQFRVLIRRHFRNSIIDYWCLIVQTIQALVMSLVLGLVFWDLGLDQRGLRDRAGFLFILCMLYPYNITMDVICQSHKERRYLYFELEDNLYGHFAYFSAKVVAEIPFHIFFVGIYFAPAYFMSSMQIRADIFFTMFGIVLLGVYTSKSYASWTANALSTYSLSSTTCNIIGVIYTLSGGYFINLDSLSSGLSWLTEISSVRWSFGSLLLTEYANMTFTCGDVVAKYCIQTGDEALELYSFSGDKVWIGVVAMISGILGFQFLAFLAMRFISQKPYDM